MLSDFSSSNSSKQKRNRKLTGKEIFQKAFSLFGAIAFLSMTGSALIKMYSNAFQPGQERAQDPTTAVSDRMSELTARETGYELVLEREPNNPVALEGLANTRIEMGDFEGAIEPLLKLIDLYPDTSKYQNSLQLAREQAS